MQQDAGCPAGLCLLRLLQEVLLQDSIAGVPHGGAAKMWHRAADATIALYINLMLYL